VEEFVEEMQDYLALLAMKPFSGEFRKDKPLAYNDYVAGKALFDHVGGRVDSIYRIDNRGRVLDRVPYDRNSIGRDLSTEPGVRFVMKHHKPYISEIFEIHPGVQGFSICRPVFEKTDFMGMICVMASLGNLNEFVFRFRPGTMDSAWIMDKDGLIVAHSNPDLVGGNIMMLHKNIAPDFDWSELANLVQRMASGEKDFGVYSSLSTREGNKTVKNIAIFMPVKLHDQVWSIALSMDSAEIAKPIQENTENTILGAGFMMLIFFIWGIIYHRNQGRKAKLEAISQWAEELRVSNRKLKLEIEQRIQAEEARQESETSYRLLAENVTDVIWIADLDLRITYVSPSVTRMLGYEIQELVGQNIEEIVSPASRQMARDVLAGNLRMAAQKREDTLRSQTLDLELLGKDGSTLWAETKLSFLFGSNNEPTGLLGVTRDITEKMHLQNQLFQAQKMESIGTLAGGIAHDFNNLLGGILGYASLIKTKTRKKHTAHGYAETIEKSANRASDLTAQLLAFARGGRCETKVLNLNSIVNETLEIIGRTFDKSIEVGVHLCESLPTVEADAGQMQQVLMNLCVNARDAMPDGGKLIIETSSETIAEGQGGVKPGSYVNLSVTDTGMGMNKETIERIFEPFFTTKEKGKGTGLGLSVIYGVVNNHGGHVHVYSEPGGGSTLKVLLPASGKPEETETPKVARRKSGTEVILVVDDEEVIRSLAKDALETYGYHVLLAQNGNEAIEIYGANESRIRLVIMDMIMPKMGGKEAFSKLKELDPQIKVLMSTGYSQDGEAKDMLNNGVLGLIQKPYQLDELLSTVRSALDINVEV
jgi:PAS domain S-box-containing protein